MNPADIEVALLTPRLEDLYILGLPLGLSWLHGLYITREK